jgi:hypothetical protein
MPDVRARARIYGISQSCVVFTQGYTVLLLWHETVYDTFYYRGVDILEQGKLTPEPIPTLMLPIISKPPTSIDTSDGEAHSPSEAELNLKTILRQSKKTHIGIVADAVGVYPA